MAAAAAAEKEEEEEELAAWSEEAARRMWRGAVPLQIHLHESDVTTLPPPPPFMALGLRIGYLPLLVPLIKAHFSSALPPGVDTVWFDYKGLPLKWYIPIGVLFDLLCAEPERPWNLTVHFRGYPEEILTPCEGEDTVKWSYINSLKEAAYIITGNSKNVMNLSQADQAALWQSVLKGNIDGYMKVSSKLKLGPVGEDSLMRTTSGERQQGSDEPESVGSGKPCRIPVRLYVRSVQEDFDDVEDAAPVDSWESISYINRPFEVHKDGGGYVTLQQAIKAMLPEFFTTEPSNGPVDSTFVERPDTVLHDSDVANTPRSREVETSPRTQNATVKLIRVQGIELDTDIPFFWVANNLKHPEYYLHVCVYVSSSKQPKTQMKS